MEKQKTLACGTCQYMSLARRVTPNANNGGVPRGLCYCRHPKAQYYFARVCPKSPRAPGFIAFTPMGGDKPQIKTSPRWCPLRLHWFPAKGNGKYCGELPERPLELPGGSAP